MNMRVLKILIVLLLLATVVVFGGFHYWQKQLDAPIALEERTVYEVPQGAAFNRVIRDLESQGIIEAAWPYRILARIAPKATQGLRAGEFEIDPGMNGRQLIAHLSSDQVVTYRLTVPEGWTFKQMRRLLDRAPKLEHRTREMSDEEVMAALGHAGTYPEGQFFPDTYRYHKGVTDTELLRRAYDRMQQTLKTVWDERDDDLPIDSSYQALILASLIERETGVATERKQIAGVFTRRLEKGMRLQTDPTVIYGMGDSYVGNITRADLQRQNAYNTYVIEGLPPTPIAMPGLGSLEAAVHPADGDTLYFVAKGDGSHQFSRTLQEHNAAVRRYILNRD
ncbi:MULTISPECIES: endolytic transglycosylase MltG [Salinicola]|uniref:Endolytic murein transglycosylase n=1 Tax=Salinicola socius TaxID=404433 RepID=A0A1Q8SW49_9GAMM|nr:MULTISPECIES: endolytic transglycosylase MltG [Salinicola]OLO05651.1 BCR, YceG family protein [Salinicola socius]